MNRVHHLPTVVAETESNIYGLDQGNEVPLYYWDGDVAAHVSSSFDLLPRNGFWNWLAALYRYWELLSVVPLDLLTNALLRQPTPKSAESASNLTVSHRTGGTSQNSLDIGQLALHPRLPLLAVYCPKNQEIRFYNLNTSQPLLKVLNRQHDSPKARHVVESSNITCMAFSDANHLAVGLASATVRVMELDLHPLLGSKLGQRKKNSGFQIQVVELLQGCNSRDQIGILGSITNVVFSPGCGTIGGVWLAITTQASGVWIWNKSMKEVVRVIGTEGLYQGCLQWLHLSTESPSIPQSPPEAKYLDESSMKKWAGIFGNAEDVLKLDEYFCPSFESSSWHDYRQMTKSTPQAIPSKSSVNINLREAHDPLGNEKYKGQSLLIAGTRSGAVRVQKLWHSSVKIRLETFAEFYPYGYPQVSGGLSPRAASPSLEITHLAASPQSIGTDHVKILIVMAFNADSSSTLHEFVVSLPFTQAALPRLLQAKALAESALQNLLHLPFLLGQTSYSWHPASSHKIHHQAIYQGSYPIHKALSRPTDRASLTSIASPMTPTSTPATILLATLRPDPSQSFGRPKHSHCVIFPRFPPSAQARPLTITPLAPLAVPFSSNPPPATLGYYTRMLHSDPVLQTSAGRRPALFCEHDFACGQVAWGRAEGGRRLGAFLYYPATVLDECVGVAIFEIAE